MSEVNDLLCGGDPKAVAEAVNFLDAMAGMLDRQIKGLPDTIDPALVALARRILFHARCMVDLLKGGSGDAVSKALIEFCYRWWPEILRACGGNEQRATVYIVEATNLAMRLGLSFDDLVAEEVPGQ